MDALDSIHGIVGTSVADYPPLVRDFVGFRVMAENSRKHLRPCIFTGDGPTAILEMAEAIARRRPARRAPHRQLRLLHRQPVPLAPRRAGGRT